MEATVASDQERLKAFEGNMEWFRGHYDKLRRKHPDRFVAINHEKVIDTDSDSFRLISRLRKQHGDLRTFAIEYVNDGKVELIL